MLNEVFPFIDAVDGWLALLLPATVRIVLWGLIMGALALALYAITSPQTSIARLKAEARVLRSRMLDVELKADEFGRVTRRNLVVSLSLLLLVIGPTLISALPVLAVASWLDVRQGFVPPKEGEPLELSTPGKFSLALISTESRHTGDGSVEWIPSHPNETVSIAVDDSVVYSGAPASVAIPVLHKAAWWNTIFANEIGYLSADSPVEEIYISVQPRRFFDRGPSWLVGWEMLFFLSVFVSALFVKFSFKIE